MTGKYPHPDFALRMQQACDMNPNVPQPNYGRLKWFVTQLEERFGVEITIETIRKWFAGEVRPRHRNVTYLAQILQVDEAWLSTGKAPEISQKQAKLRNASADGAVNLIAGMIQIHGGNPAFPNEPGTTDLHAIIKGAMYNLHVAMALTKNDDLVFSVPVDATENLIIGVVQGEGLNFRVYELPWDQIESLGSKSGPSWIVSVESGVGREITTFAERL